MEYICIQRLFLVHLMYQCIAMAHTILTTLNWYNNISQYYIDIIYIISSWFIINDARFIKTFSFKVTENCPHLLYPIDVLLVVVVVLVCKFCSQVALIRMTSDGRLPAEQKRNYSNIFDALIRMTREEGVLTLWRGAIPTMGRAMVVNAAQLASYSQAKQGLMWTGNMRQWCHFGYILWSRDVPSLRWV